MSESRINSVQYSARPLASQQLSIWIAQKLDPASPAYNIAEYIEILGEVVDRGMFWAALRQTIHEIDALRLQVVEASDRPRQATRLLSEITELFVDFRSESDPCAAADRWMRAQLERVIDTTRDPLFNYALLQIASDHFIWFTHYHHLCLDGFGGALVARHVAEIYSAYCNRQNVATKVHSVCELYDDEDRYRLSPSWEVDRAYWSMRLAGVPELVTLSGKRPEPCRRFIRVDKELTPALADAIRAVATSHSASLPQVITAAVALYLSRLTGADDLAIGLSVTARHGNRMRSIPGMISNTLPLRLAVSPQDRFGDLLLLTSRRMREMLRHQRYRSEDLRQDLGYRTGDPDVYGTVVNTMSFDYRLRFGKGISRVHNLSNGPVNDLSIVVYDRLDGSSPRLVFDANPTHYT